MIIYSLVALAAGYVMDMMFGDIFSAYSLSKFMEKTANFFKDKLKARYVSSHEGQTLAGSLLLALMIILFIAPLTLLLVLAYKLHPVVGVILESFYVFGAINEKKVNYYGTGILKALRKGKPLAARRKLMEMTGENTKGMREDEIVKLSVRGIAEYTFENAIAPLFFIFIGGGIGGLVYLVINRTAKAVRSEDIYFSLAARGMNDVLGYFPARLAAFLSVKDARLLALDFLNAQKIWKRDGKNLGNINASQTVAAFAGALDIEVVGNIYEDEPFIPSQHIGDPKKEPDQSDIFYAQQISYGAVFIAAVAFMAVRLILGLIF